MPLARPTVIQCAFCGTDVPVGERGNIPKFCKDHRDAHRRKVVEQEQQPDVDPDAPPGVRVCRPKSCLIPLADLWGPEFCPAHWRILSTEVKGGLLAAARDSHAYEVQVLRALREITKFEGRPPDQAFEDARVVEVG